MAHVLSQVLAVAADFRALAPCVADDAAERTIEGFHGQMYACGALRQAVRASRAQVLGSPVGEALLVPQRILVKQRRTHG